MPSHAHGGKLATLRYDQYDRGKLNTVRRQERTNSSLAAHRISPHLSTIRYIYIYSKLV